MVHRDRSTESTEHGGRLRIVAIGGGTGLSTLLGGLKEHVDVEIGPPGHGLTAVVTVTDNGGSSGRLRDEFNILPPGDIRNCMVALAEDEQLGGHHGVAGTCASCLHPQDGAHRARRHRRSGRGSARRGEARARGA